MKRRGIARFAATMIVAWCALMSTGWLAAPALAQSRASQQPAGLPAPGNFKAAPGGDHIALTWDAVNGASSYTIYRGTSSHSETLYKAGITSALFDNTSHVTKGAIYYYEVAAVDNQGIEGARSSEAASSTDTAVASTAPSASHAPAPTKAPGNGTVWWVLLGVISLALLIGGVFLFLRQHQGTMEPMAAYDADLAPQSGVFVAPQPAAPTNPRAVAAQTFPPREWNEMSPSERAGVSGIFTPPPPPESEDYGRQLGAVAFWDDPAEQGNTPQSPRERDVERHQWTYPEPPAWPPRERGR